VGKGEIARIENVLLFPLTSPIPEQYIPIQLLSLIIVRKVFKFHRVPRIVKPSQRINNGLTPYQTTYYKATKIERVADDT